MRTSCRTITAIRDWSTFGPYGAAFDTEGNFWFVDSGNDGPTQELGVVQMS